MSTIPPDIKKIYNLIGDEFDLLDRQIGSRNKRLHAITAFPQLSRDLYLVHDIVAITCNSGTGAWIHYHHDEPHWIECAEDAFVHIGYPQISAGIKSCLATYLIKRDSMTSEDDRTPSHFIMEHEHEIIRSLHTYLVAQGYSFDSQKI